MSEFCQVAEAIITATNPAGLSLYAGVAAEPRVDDVPGRAFQLVAVLRELRGSTHLLSFVASGLAPEVVHAIKRLDDVGTFGSDLVAAKALTDRLLLSAYGELDEDAAAALVPGTRVLGPPLRFSTLHTTF